MFPYTPVSHCASRTPTLTSRSHVFHSQSQLSHIRGGVEVWYHLATPLVSEEVLDFEPALLSLTFLPHLYPQDCLLGLPLGACLEEVVLVFASCTSTTSTHQSALRPVKVLSGEAVTHLQMVES